MKKIVKKNFFSLIGFIVLILSLVILIYALIARNAYEIVLSSAMLLFMLVLGIIGAYTARKLAGMEPGWKPPYPFTAMAGEPTVISGLDANIPIFFRLHFVVKGKFNLTLRHSGTVNINNFYTETSVSKGENTAKLEMDFPMSGVFNGEGVCKLRDVFGLFSFTCGQTLHRTFNIRSSPCFGKEVFINAQSGAEDRRHKQSADEERYYMREYTPGDRFRDINWKSSEKIDTLITRISPENQEKISRIEIYFRNFGNTDGKGKQSGMSLEELWLLDRAKARLSYFLRSLKERPESFIFDIKSADKSWEIEDDEQLDSFLEDLACLSFLPCQNEAGLITENGNGEIYVFSTACDLGLQSFLLASQMRPVSLFLINGTKEKRRGTNSNEQLAMNNEQKITNNVSQSPEILYKRDFLFNGIILNPKWLFRSKIKPTTVQTAKTEIFYAGTKL